MGSSLSIQFWGVRGSVPSPGPSTVRYGGNTSCVSIDPGEGKVLILDAGTGIRALGKTLEASQEDIFILLSHSHWDHIQGFPFFKPLYQKDRKIYIFPTQQGKDMLCSLIEQMDGAFFPVKPENLPSHHECITEDQVSFLRKHSFHVARIATNHPGGGFGYRVEHNGRSVMYVTDNELDPPYRKTTSYDGFKNFCYRADIMIHDAQYLGKDMPLKHGWGHSQIHQVRQLAADAGVKHLILFHHDPDRTDDELDTIQEETLQWFKENDVTIRCTVAYEGLVLRI